MSSHILQITSPSFASDADRMAAMHDLAANLDTSDVARASTVVNTVISLLDPEPTAGDEGEATEQRNNTVNLAINDSIRPRFGNVPVTLEFNPNSPRECSEKCGYDYNGNSVLIHFAALYVWNNERLFVLKGRN